MNGADRALRGVEVGTRALWAVLAVGLAWILWRKFRPAPLVRTEILDAIPPVDPERPDVLPPPREQATPEGIVAGGLTTAVSAQILQPALGGRVYRSLFRASFPVELEVVNEGSDRQRAQVEIVGTFYELAGGVRPNVRTLLEPQWIGPGDVVRLEVEVDSGNVNGGAYEFGQASAVFAVLVNGIQTQSTSFEVW